ncbi:MAG: oligoribonuclease [Deltaproteobacteria bacterium]|nr:oligoribonuclease [Deltaproteobacteria bacterium]
MNDKLIWVDLEMTGLDPEKGHILEIASIVTDSDLEIIAEGPNLAINYPEEIVRSMDEWSKSHHGASGLVDRVKSSHYDCKKAEEVTLRFLSQYCKRGESPLCGNSVWQDRRFLVKHMPRLESFLHYRNIDVSTIKELVRRWYPSLPAYEKRKAHLALSDIKESINELRYYRETVFVGGITLKC